MQAQCRSTVSVERVQAVNCKACGAELVLTSVVPNEDVLNCEHHTFICSECHVTERRAVFIRNGREYDSGPAPADLPPAVLHARSAEQDRLRIPNFLARLVLKLWGQRSNDAIPSFPYATLHWRSGL